MWFWAIVFSIGIGVLSGYLTAYEFCYPYSNRPSRCYSDSVYQAGINAGASLTAIGGFFGLCSCLWLGKRLEKAEQTTNTGTVARNTTATTTTRNQGITEFNPLGQEVRNLGTEVNANHEVIELNPLGQEAKNPGAEAIDIEQGQSQQITELQRRLTQLENQINQQQEAKIEVITS